MTTKTEGNHDAEFILDSEENMSLEKVVLITGQNLLAGTVLGKITASGKYTQHATGAADGSQVASVILRSDCDATSIDKPCVVIARLAEVADSKLIYMTGITAPNKTAAIAALLTANIIVRT
jgi:hypothetical protein